MMRQFKVWQLHGVRYLGIEAMPSGIDNLMRLT